MANFYEIKKTIYIDRFEIIIHIIDNNNLLYDGFGMQTYVIDYDNLSWIRKKDREDFIKVCEEIKLKYCK